MKTKTSPICIRLPKSWIAYLKNRSREISYKNNKDISFHDLIRESILKDNKEIENEKRN